MAMKDGMLPEFDHEMALTRKVIERVAEDKLGWAPHEKSMSLGPLNGAKAGSVQRPSWILVIMIAVPVGQYISWPSGETETVPWSR